MPRGPAASPPSSGPEAPTPGSEGAGFVEDGFLFSAHPDPSWARRSWISLDGPWRVRRGRRVREVRVPFPIGSGLGGADFPDRGSFEYSRDFDLAPDAARGSVILRVGACDYETVVEVNGREAGRHVGGYSSFALDVTAFVRPGRNRIVLWVRDSHSPFQVRGKQTFLRGPFMVWYSGISGPWQSVWLETAGPWRLDRPRVRADFDAGVVRIEAPAVSAGRDLAAREPESRSGNPSSARPAPSEIPAPAAPRLAVDLESPGGGSSRFEAELSGTVFRVEIPFEAVPGPRWSPDTPALHRLRYTLSAEGRVSDAVESYLGLRRIEARDGRILLNGAPINLRMALVQGYFPGGWYTPRTPEGYRDDIEALKRMGFNGARIHEKIESPYFHFLADRLGLLTTFEMPSFYLPSRTAFRAYESELCQVVERDSMHPSGIAWILFNETWGVWGLYGRASRTRSFVRSMIDLVRALDPGRPVIDNSGWEHLDSDIVDVHHYLKSSRLARDAYAAFRRGDPRVLARVSVPRVLLFYILNRIGTETRSVFLDVEARSACEKAPWILSEYGGFGWYASAEGGTVPERIEAYTRDAVECGLFQGYCLTQLYDVGTETNGILDFERKPKVAEDGIRRANEIPFRSFRNVEEGP